MKLLSLVLTFAFLVSCSKETRIIEKTESVPESGGIVYSKPVGKHFPDLTAERLVRLAERLMSPVGFMFANDVLDEALKKDPEYRKAHFYKALLKPLLKLKGVVAKLKPLLQKVNPKVREALDERMFRMASGGLKDFLLESDKPFETEEDVRRFLLEYFEVVDETRKYLKANADMVLTINFNYVLGGEKLYEECSVRKISEGTYELSECRWLKLSRFFFDRGDFEIFRQVFSGLQVLTASYTAYNTTGLINYYHLEASEEPFSRAMGWKMLAQTDGFGTLKADNKLNLVSQLTTDFVAGVKWARKLQTALCPAGEPDSENRREYLFSMGYCVPGTAKAKNHIFAVEALVALVEISLRGAAGTLDFGNVDKSRLAEAAKSRPIRMHPMAPILSPLPEIKSQIPKFNRCDEVSGLSDPTLGGVFPDGNAEEVFGVQQEDCKPSDYYLHSHHSGAIYELYVKEWNAEQQSQGNTESHNYPPWFGSREHKAWLDQQGFRWGDALNPLPGPTFDSNEEDDLDEEDF